MENAHNEQCDVLLIGYEEWENLGLRSLAAFLSDNGVSVCIQPYKKGLREEILQCILRVKPKIVGFSLIFQRMLDDFAGLIDFLRHHNVTAHFTIGGHFPTVEYIGVMQTIKGLDSIIRCEGEQALLELLQNIDKSGSWEKIDGLVFRSNGKIRVNPPRKLIENLDLLPFPIRSHKGASHRGKGLFSISGSRGCYYDCSFCSIRQFYSASKGPKRRSRSPQNIVQEMIELFNKRNARIFIFEDDDFAMKSHHHQQWIEDFIKELEKSKIADQIIWRISCRVDEIDSKIIREMKEVGLISVYIGIESGNNLGLKTYNKHYTVDDIYKKIEILRDMGMPFEFGFMILNPYSTLTTVKEDIAFLKQIGNEGDAVVHFTKMVPYAGTPIERRLKNERRLKGTLAAPDYTYLDPKLDLLQMFFSSAFHFRNFDDNGLVERLRHAKFDSLVLNKFYPEKYDSKHYIQTIRGLIRECNRACLMRMSLATNFMEKQTDIEILDNWHFLESLVEQEKDEERHITSSLNQIMNTNM